MFVFRILFFFLMPTIGLAQENLENISKISVCAKKPYKYIGFEGGGIKGTVYAGAVRALEEYGVLQHLEGFSGSSSGSKAAALLAAGYSGAELQEQLMNFDFASLLDDSSTTYNLLGKTVTIGNPLADMNRMVEKFGWYKGEKLEKTIDKLIEEKTGKPRTTFKELWEFSGKKLRITGTCVTTGLLTWFDKDNTPDMPVSLAVHASSAIPFFYQPVEYEGKLYVDGGCLKNLPHDAFREEEGSMLALSIRDGGIRGVRVNEDITSLMEFAYQLADTVAFGPDSHNSLSFDDDLGVDVVQIPFGSVSVSDFYIKHDQKAFLVVQGYRTIKNRLAQCGYIEDNTSDPKWVRVLETASEAEIERQRLIAKGEIKLESEWLPYEARLHMNEAKKQLDRLSKDMDFCYEQQRASGKDLMSCHFEVIVTSDTSFIYHMNQAAKHIILENSFLISTAFVFYFLSRVACYCMSCCRRKPRRKSIVEDN